MRTALVCCVTALCIAGCEGDLGETKPESLRAKETTPGPPPPPVLKQRDLPSAASGQGEIAENEPKAPTAERIKAEVGVAKKGRRLEDERMVKMIATPAVALFRTQERIVFEIQIPKAMQLYEALHGKKPATHEEFLQIMKENRITLPALPTGQRYVYDSQQGELMVERPAR